jgi:hypothetical protein
MPDNEVFDLDAARARRLEEKGDLSVHFTFGGEKFTTTRADEWPFDVAEDLAAGNVREALRSILGPSEYDRFAAHHPSMSDLNDLFEYLSALTLGSSGNSARSGGSSSRTPRSSKPTSRSSTT